MAIPYQMQGHPTRDHPWCYYRRILCCMSRTFNINCRYYQRQRLQTISKLFGEQKSCRRGAAKVYFIENYNKSLEILNKNIKKLKCEKKTKVFNKDVFNFFESEEIKNGELDLIFLDPPYKEENIEIILENIVKLKLLKTSGLIVLHRHKKSKDNFSSKFNIKRSVKYGISKIIFIQIN